MRGRQGTRSRVRIVEHRDGSERRREDWLATEEPLEIRLTAPGLEQRVGVTMRTPGDDFALAAGFLLSEGALDGAGDVRTIRYCVDRELDEEQRFNVVTVDLARPPLAGDLAVLERHVTITSACGVCGRQTVDDLEERGLTAPAGDRRLDPEVVAELPDRLRDAQRVFDRTGGLHAAGLFTSDGELVAAREDVGRHNAVDKVVGWALLEDRLPLDDRVLVVSGRASFELVQKAVVAGIPAMAAVGAPSSLAVEVARRFGVTLVGFCRDGRFNVYSGADRIAAVEGRTDGEPAAASGRRSA